jgi:energy-coupling factor transporter ATP-binding protein EcfA2
MTTKDTGEKLKDAAAKWGVPGVSYVLALNFVMSGDIWRAILACFVPFCLSLVAKFFERLDPSINNLFDWIIKNLENGVLQMWWRITTDFKHKYYQQLIFQCRDYRTQGLKTKGPFALNLEKVFVPLRVTPESLGQISSDMLKKKAAKNDLRIWDLLTERKGQAAYQSLAILGPPGSGKSTLLEHMALTYARNRQRDNHSKAKRFVPVLLYLRDIREKISQPNAPDLHTLIEQQPEIKKLNPNGWFLNQLQKGKCLVMLDGLDEVADASQRKQVSQWVGKQIKAFPKSYFIVTSRPFGYRNMPLDEITATLEVQPFTLSQAKTFIKNWYLQNELMRHSEKEDDGILQTARKQSNDLIDRISKQPALSKLALNPLLLTMIATVHCYRGALPGRRVELYDEICDVLLGRRQDAKGISDFLTAAQKKTVLQVLALGLMVGKTREFSLETAASFIQKKLTTVSGQTNAIDFLRDIEQQSGLLIEREKDVYEFTHKSFQEYLAAVEISSLKGIEWLVTWVDDVWWAETIRLCSAQSDATPFIQVAINSNDIKVLSLAFDCLEEKLIVQPSVQEQFERKLLHGLENPNAKIFNLAAETKLSRRLNKLLRIDERTAIDTSYVTCAEYQLFLDEQRKQNNRWQPDHWHSHHFPNGTANEPIVGIRATDASEFCQWLSHRTGQYYRLPYQSEVGIYQITESEISAWNLVSDSIKLDLSQIPDNYLQSWRSKIRESLRDFLQNNFDHPRALSRALKITSDKDFSYPHNLDVSLDFDHGLRFIREIARSIARDLGRDRSLSLVRNKGLACELALARAYDVTQSIAIARTKGNTREPNLTLDLDRELTHAYKLSNKLYYELSEVHNRYPELALALDLDLSRELVCVLDLSLKLSKKVFISRKLARDRYCKFEEVSDYLSNCAIFWEILARFHEQGSSRKRWSPSKREHHRTYQLAAKRCIKNFEKTLDVCIFSITIHLRQTGELPVWEGIRVVKEEI